MSEPTLFEMDLPRAFAEEKKRAAPRDGFPKNSTELRFRGYQKTGNGQCRGCAAAVEWWLTPTGHRIPINPMPELLTPAIAHWATCPKAEEFRKGRR